MGVSVLGGKEKRWVKLAISNADCRSLYPMTVTMHTVKQTLNGYLEPKVEYRKRIGRYCMTLVVLIEIMSYMNYI